MVVKRLDLTAGGAFLPAGKQTIFGQNDGTKVGSGGFYADRLSESLWKNREQNIVSL